MSQAPLTPTRKKQLEAYIACCVRAERSILAAGHIVRGTSYSPDSWQRKSKRVQALTKRMRKDGESCYTLAFIRLQIARSKFAAELSGLGYHG